MSNMSFCRFIDTYRDLQDCYDNLYDEDLSEEEQRYRRKLVELCKDIADDTADGDFTD